MSGQTFIDIMKQPSKFKFYDEEGRKRLLHRGHLDVRIAFGNQDDGLKGMLHTIYYAGDALAVYHGTKDEFLACLDRVPGTLKGYREGYNHDTKFHVKHLEGQEVLPQDRVEDHSVTCDRLVPEDDRFVARMAGPFVYHPTTPCSCGRDPHKRWGSSFYTDHPDRGKTPLQQRLRELNVPPVNTQSIPSPVAANVRATIIFGGILAGLVAAVWLFLLAWEANAR